MSHGIPTARLIDAVANNLNLIDCAKPLGLTAKALSRLLGEHRLVRSWTPDDVPVVSIRRPTRKLFMAPIVRVIAHTSFVGVPVDLLPIEKTRNQQATRFAEACTAHDQDVAARTAKQITSYPVPPDEGQFISEAVIEAEARRLVNAADQDRGTDAERLVECAGRACYDSYGNGRNSPDYHKHILDVNHGSVMEHANITFFLGNISRGCTHELVRHRVGVAISQRSTRYVDENESMWAQHPLLEAFLTSGLDVAAKAPNGEATEVTLGMRVGHVVGTAQQTYRLTVEKLQAWLISRGADKFTARKQARGAARGLLGNALSTEMVWTVNLRALRGIIDQRVKAAADAEIRILFGRIWEEAKSFFPAYLKYEKRSCPDGLGFELFDPNSPVERLRATEDKLANALDLLKLAKTTHG